MLEQEQAALAAAQAQTVAIAARLAATRKAAEEEKREKERREAEQRELERQALLLAAREQERRANDEVEEARKAFEAAQLRASAARRASLTAAGEPAVAAVSGGPAGVAPSKPVHGVKPSDIKASLKNNESAEAGAPKLTARVAAAYTAQDGTQLSLRESEVIEVLDSSDPAGRGWWYGRNTDGTEGYFPRDFVNSLPA